jgi:hypothetical protein
MIQAAARPGCRPRPQPAGRSRSGDRRPGVRRLRPLTGCAAYALRRTAGLPAGVLPKAPTDRPAASQRRTAGPAPTRRALPRRRPGALAGLSAGGRHRRRHPDPTVDPRPAPPRTFGVRALENAVSLRGLLDAGPIGRALVVGTDHLGLEMAAALVHRGVHVVLVELTDRVQSPVDPPLVDQVSDEVRRHGIDLRRTHRVGRGAFDDIQVVCDDRWAFDHGGCRGRGRPPDCSPWPEWRPGPAAPCWSTTRCARPVPPHASAAAAHEPIPA